MCADAGKQGLMQWLLRRIKAKAPFDANKLYASELLSILLQSTPENRLLLGELDGIDVLLQQLAVCIILLFILFYLFHIVYQFILLLVLQTTRSSNGRGARNDGKFI